MQIKEYEVVINEKNATCGFIIDLNQYDLESFLNQDLKYEVLPNNFMVKVFSSNKEIYFINLDINMIYYAFKTINLIILAGWSHKENPIEMAAQAVLV